MSLFLWNKYPRLKIGDAMISQILKKRRLALNKKPSQIALKIGVAESTYRDWENGRRIQGEPYKKIAEALEMNILDLLGIKQEGRRYVEEQLERMESCIKNIRENATI